MIPPGSLTRTNLGIMIVWDDLDSYTPDTIAVSCHTTQPPTIIFFISTTNNLELFYLNNVQPVTQFLMIKVNRAKIFLIL